MSYVPPKLDRFGLDYKSPTWLADSQKAYGDSMAGFFQRREARLSSAERLRQKIERAEQEVVELTESTVMAQAPDRMVRL